MGKGQVHSEGITLFLSRVPDGTQRGLNRSTNPAINRWATIGRPFGTVHARYDSSERQPQSCFPSPGDLGRRNLQEHAWQKQILKIAEFPIVEDRDIQGVLFG